MSIDKITLKSLQKISYQGSSAFQFNFKQQLIECQQLIRIVPQKRLVFMGRMVALEQTVIIKLFIHHSRSKKHWQRELSGTQLLLDNSILSPELLLSGNTDEAIYFLVFNYIEGQNLAQFWAQNDQINKENKLKELMPVLSQHHLCGLAHQDLHYGNFYLSDKPSSIYTLDGEELKSSASPLNKKASLKNLALFLAQTFDLTQAAYTTLLYEYKSIRNFDINKKNEKKFYHWIKNFQQQRVKQYLKKILRPCTEVIYQQKEHSYQWCKRKLHNPKIQQLLDQPEQFFQHKSAIFLKQGNTCTVKSVQVDSKSYVIKRYNPKGMAYEISHIGQIPRAKKSWINSHLLLFMGISTPQPIALIEQNNGLGKRCSYFISEYQQGQNSWDFFCDKYNSDKNKKLVATHLMNTLNKLCEYNISHGDLKGSNFLIHNNKVWLLDLDAMSQHKSDWKFNKNWQRDKLRFLKNWNKKSCYAPWKIYFNHFLNNIKT